jgi:hypothetical protein
LAGWNQCERGIFADNFFNSSGNPGNADFLDITQELQSEMNVLGTRPTDIASMLLEAILHLPDFRLESLRQLDADKRPDQSLFHSALWLAIGN